MTTHDAQNAIDALLAGKHGAGDAYGRLWLLDKMERQGALREADEVKN